MDGPVRQRSLWEHNLALVLRQVAAGTRTSRAEIAASVGLTRATVSSLVEDLLAAGLIAETEPAPRTGVGRPAAGLVLSLDGPAGLGLEINVDYLAACVLDLTGAVRQHAVRRVDQRHRDPAEVLRDVAELAAEAVAAVKPTVAGARLAVPGLLDDAGLVLIAPNLGWRDVDLRALLRAAPAWPGLPVTVENEANLAALAELSTVPESSFLYVSGEVGVGAGIVLGGELFRGRHGWSGEIGHMPVVPDGPVCRCGARGCLEQYAGQEAILTSAGIPAGPAMRADVAVRRLVELAGAGNPAVLGALHTAGTALGRAIAGAVNLLDLDTVVLGGSFAPLAHWLREPLTAELTARVLTSAWCPVLVRASALGAKATVIGAAGSVRHDILAAPAAWLANSHQGG